MEMRHEAQDLKMVYEAALSGCVTTLNNIFQRDPLILNRVSLSNLTETPLHVSSLLGHLDFTVALLQRCPRMALERDSLKRLPLHLACAEGHGEIVKVLLSACSNSRRDVCLARDEDGKIPLHLAVLRGRIGFIRDLVTTCLESTSELLDGDTAFHLCVKYNQLDALKLLVEIVDDDVLLNRGNQDGDTILHLAVILKELEVTRYLLSLSEVKERVNTLNNEQQTALDLLEKFPSMDVKSILIRDILTRADAKRAAELNSNNNVPIPTSNLAPISTSSTSKSKAKSWFKKLIKFIEYDRQEIRGALMIVATVIATMSYQTTINPPGGVWQQNSVDPNIGLGCSNTDICEAGTSVLGHSYPSIYRIFLISNTSAFFGSLLVIALVVSGFPLKNKFCVWLLAQALILTLAASSLSYAFGMAMVTPWKLKTEMTKFCLKMYFGWAGLFSVAAVFEIVRFLVWTAKKLKKFWRKFKNKRRTSRINAETPTA